MDKFAIPGIIKQSPWQLDFPYLHTVMALPERHTDVSIYGFIEISSNTKVYLKTSFYILKNQNKGQTVKLVSELPQQHLDAQY